jgi:hypothetical protein
MRTLTRSARNVRACALSSAHTTVTCVAARSARTLPCCVCRSRISVSPPSPLCLLVYSIASAAPELRFELRSRTHSRDTSASWRATNAASREHPSRCRPNRKHVRMSGLHRLARTCPIPTLHGRAFRRRNVDHNAARCWHESPSIVENNPVNNLGNDLINSVSHRPPAHAQPSIDAVQ